ncbi:MAG: hypothetical protein QMD80_00985 [archaeon]|nr:hypothetical protein [archaeon]
MKPISVIALIFVLILGGLFIYVAEDIPAFGDPNSAPNRYVKLFSIDADEIEGDLNQGNIPASLLDKIEETGLPLPTKVEKARELEGEWVEGEWEAFIIPEEKYYALPTTRFGTAPDAPKEQRYYLIKKEGDTLDVYRYAPIIRYIEEGEHETEVPNMVTYILADYRGYDTLGETTVIFTAGVSVILLLRRRGKMPK